MIAPYSSRGARRDPREEVPVHRQPSGVPPDIRGWSCHGIGCPLPHRERNLPIRALYIISPTINWNGIEDTLDAAHPTVDHINGHSAEIPVSKLGAKFFNFFLFGRDHLGKSILQRLWGGYQHT
jgi:hypothetical protein